MSAPIEKITDAIIACAGEIEAHYSACFAAQPNFGVTQDEFASAVWGAIDKYLVVADGDGAPTPERILEFLSELQLHDLFLAMACARGNERAWWEFDRNYRPYIERVARHVASVQLDAEEVLDSVYVELYGTKVVDDVRHSKFATYTGRGTLKGWLRTVVWHAMIDLHRAKKDEIWIDEWSETGGEMRDRPGTRAELQGSERQMLDRLSRERYRTAMTQSLDAAFVRLDDHEKLLLLYYHVEGLKLREIARMVEQMGSPLRRWFQRQAKRRVDEPTSRVHESTVMRWLDKVYDRIMESFREALRRDCSLNESEIELCVAIGVDDLAIEDIQKRLGEISPEGLGKGDTA